MIDPREDGVAECSYTLLCPTAEPYLNTYYRFSYAICGLMTNPAAKVQTGLCCCVYFT